MKTLVESMHQTALDKGFKAYVHGNVFLVVNVRGTPLIVLTFEQLYIAMES